MDVQQSIMGFLKNNQSRNYPTDKLARELNMQKAGKFTELVKAIAELEREGFIEFTQAGNVKLKRHEVVVQGVYRANERGFGFVEIEDEEMDVFIPKGKSEFAMNGDVIQLEITKPSDHLNRISAEGRIIEVLERKLKQVVGEFHPYSKEEGEERDLIGYVLPKEKKLSNYRVEINATGLKAEEGNVVIAEVTHYPETGYEFSLEGFVNKIVGDKSDLGIDVLESVLSFGIEPEFSEETLEYVKAIPDEIDPAEFEGRVDYRDEQIITIDGADAKDLDDAVTVTKLENGNYRLGVHIADVSHYVVEGTPLHHDALDRATSIYLADRVIPMLPEKLSNGLCSLNPKVDRLCMSCVMEIDTASAKVINYKIHEGVIKTTERMTYDDVNLILEGQGIVYNKPKPRVKKPEEIIGIDAVRFDDDDELPLIEDGAVAPDELLPESMEFALLLDEEHNAKIDSVSKKYEHITPQLLDMSDLFEILESAKMRRGAIEFKSKESKIVLDETGKPMDVIMRERGIAERIIENFMLLANETVASHFEKLKAPGMYRIHEEPTPEKMARFLSFVAGLGLNLRGTRDKVSHKELQQVLADFEGEPEELVVNTLLLRSMQQAKYSDSNYGHYGLALQNYTHFTSPIRRYPDLIVHRLLKTYGKDKSGKWYKNPTHDKIPMQVIQDLEGELGELAIHTSSRERRSVDVERDVAAMKKTEYMREFIGEEFDAVISSVVKFGIFVELENSIEGMIHITKIPGFYEFNEATLSLVNRKTSNILRIGDSVRVKVDRAVVETRTIDFELIGEEFVHEGSRTDNHAQKIYTPKHERKDKKKKKANADYVIYSNANNPDGNKDSKGKHHKHKAKNNYKGKKSGGHSGGKSGGGHGGGHASGGKGKGGYKGGKGKA
ncbi:MAG: RNB domain-containing ribonuclease [Lactobacillales bacterium]|jgi:ribonuclease R|nr:RNB domain-containing ribonuclease [Lactobacillales bacterium]